MIQTKSQCLTSRLLYSTVPLQTVLLSYTNCSRANKKTTDDYIKWYLLHFTYNFPLLLLLFSPGYYLSVPAMCLLHPSQWTVKLSFPPYSGLTMTILTFSFNFYSNFYEFIKNSTRLLLFVHLSEKPYLDLFKVKSNIARSKVILLIRIIKTISASESLIHITTHKYILHVCIHGYKTNTSSGPNEKQFSLIF